MRDLLLLVQRIPYPPNKGDKIASWNLLKYLSERYRVHLGAFVDDPHDWQYADTLRERCASVHLEGIDPARRKLWSLHGLATGEPLSVAFYRHRAMQAWVDARLAEGVDRIVAFSSAMARYVTGATRAHRVMDFVDIDSDKWRQYAAQQPWPMSWLYRREARLLLAWERRIAREFDWSAFVSDAEAADFRRMAPESAARTVTLSNGVDAEFFTPEADHPNPYPAGKRVVVFTGAMDYYPNVDAVEWFARQVLPAARVRWPDLAFYIVGGKPTPAVRALEGEGVVVTGRVADVRPYLAHAAAVTAPLRIARGIQNKVLEGMAMARTVITSPQGLEGIAARPGAELLVADTPEQHLEALGRVLAGLDLGAAARARVLAEYAWPARLAKPDVLLEPGA